MTLKEWIILFLSSDTDLTNCSFPSYWCSLISARNIIHFWVEEGWECALLARDGTRAESTGEGWLVCTTFSALVCVIHTASKPQSLNVDQKKIVRPSQNPKWSPTSGSCSKITQCPAPPIHFLILCTEGFQNFPEPTELEEYPRIGEKSSEETPNVLRCIKPRIASQRNELFVMRKRRTSERQRASN